MADTRARLNKRKFKSLGIIQDESLVVKKPTISYQFSASKSHLWEGLTQISSSLNVTQGEESAGEDKLVQLEDLTSQPLPIADGGGDDSLPGILDGGDTENPDEAVASAEEDAAQLVAVEDDNADVVPLRSRSMPKGRK
eukprot:8284792-Karenia_brevis.AAC.1